MGTFSALGGAAACFKDFSLIQSTDPVNVRDSVQAFCEEGFTAYVQFCTLGHVRTSTGGVRVDFVSERARGVYKFAVRSEADNDDADATVTVIANTVKNELLFHTRSDDAADDDDERRREESSRDNTYARRVSAEDINLLSFNCIDDPPPVTLARPAPLAPIIVAAAASVPPRRAPRDDDDDDDVAVAIMLLVEADTKKRKAAFDEHMHQKDAVITDLQDNIQKLAREANDAKAKFEHLKGILTKLAAA